jgi:outer membrane protein
MRPHAARSVHRRVALAAVLGALLPASTQAADLMAVYRAAQAHDPVIRGASSALAATEARLPEARAALLPQLVASGGKSETQADTQFTSEPHLERDSRSWNWSIQLTQPVLRYDSYFQFKQAAFVVEQARQQFRMSSQDLIVRTAQAYFAVNEAVGARDAADAEITALQEQLSQARHGFERGTHAITEVDETRARLGAAQARRIALQSDLVNATSDLRRLTGVDYAALAGLDAAARLPDPVPASREDWLARARNGAPGVLAQQAALAAARLEVDKARSGHLPTVDIVASVGANASAHSLTTPDDYGTRIHQRVLGVQLSVPLFSGGAIGARVDQALGALGKAQADLDGASASAESDAEHAFNAVMSGLAQIDALDQAVVSAQSALKGTRAGYDVGLRVNLDVLNAEHQLYDSRRDLLKARYETLLQGLKLKAAVGDLQEHDLMVVNAWLQDAPRAP